MFACLLNRFIGYLFVSVLVCRDCLWWLVECGFVCSIACSHACSYDCMSSLCLLGPCYCLVVCLGDWRMARLFALSIACVRVCLCVSVVFGVVCSFGWLIGNCLFA